MKLMEVIYKKMVKELNDEFDQFEEIENDFFLYNKN